MIKNQTLYPEHGQNDHPILSLDGQKAESIIDAYREPTEKKLEKSKAKTFNLNLNPTGSGSD